MSGRSSVRHVQVAFEVFTELHTEGPFELSVGKTVMQEVGHHIGAGRADDNDTALGIPVEVYSGSQSDTTPESVGYTGLDAEEWSIMTSGWTRTVDNPPMRGKYFVFSIEELSTVEFREIDTVAD